MNAILTDDGWRPCENYWGRDEDKKSVNAILPLFDVCLRDECRRPLSLRQVQKDGKYCSTDCANKDKGMVPRGLCQHCNRPLRKGQRVACSRICAGNLNSGHERRSEDLKEKLRELWNEGLTTTQIGDRLGVTKNVIVGLRARMGLPTRGNPINRDPAKAVQPRACQQCGTEFHPEKSAAKYCSRRCANDAMFGTRRHFKKPQRNLFVARSPSALPLLDEHPALLEMRELAEQVRRAPRYVPEPRGPAYSPFRTCQFALNDSRPWRWCDAPTLSGSSYCREHHRVCYRPLLAA